MSKKNGIDKILGRLKAVSNNLAVGKSAAPVDLPNGLVLKMTKLNDDLWQLTAWRKGVAPSVQEIGVLVESIRKEDDPRLIVRRKEPQESADGKYHAYKLYWWTVPVVVSHHQPIQREIFNNGEGKKGAGDKRHNYARD